MKHRLYVPPPIETGQTLDLDAERAHYLLRVLRLRRGETVECFDGSGRAWAATLADARPKSARLDVGEVVTEAPAPAPAVHLALGMLKGSAMDTAVQKATELGATDLWPLLAERSNVPTDAAWLEKKQRHWQRITESAAEQCGALHLTRLHGPRNPARFFDEAPNASMILLDPGAPVLPMDLPLTDTLLLVGPEGGWSDDERRAADAAGAIRHGLGGRILRAETAPLALLAALRHGWRWE